MGIKTEISWTDVTWNPWQGCTKVSPACRNCYMFRDLKRYGRDGSIVVRSKPPTFNLPLKTVRGGGYAIHDGSKVFTCSWSDWFHSDADPWRDEAWEIIRSRPGVIFQIVTKRPERIRACLPDDWGDGWPNVWLIATAENQHYAHIRVAELLNVPAAILGLSVEPMLGPIDLRVIGEGAATGIYTDALSGVTYGPDGEALHRGRRINWVIVGGESGPNARPMHPDWARAIRDQCQAAGVPFHFKQWGEYGSATVNLLTGQNTFRQFTSFDHWVAKASTWVNGGICLDADGNELKTGRDFAIARDEGRFPVTIMHRVGKKLAGRELDGRTWDEFPA